MSSTSSDGRPASSASAMRFVHAWIASTYLAGSVACEPTWNDRPRTRTPRRRASSIRPSTAPGSQPNFFDRSHDRRRAAERHAQQQLGALAIAHELADLVRVVGDEGRDAETQRVANVAVALDRVRVNAALRARCPAPCTSSTSPVVARSKNAPSSRRRRDYGCVRQRLQRVVEIDARQRSVQRAVLAADLFAVDDQQRRTETGGQPRISASVSVVESKEWAGETARDCLAARGNTCSGTS